MIKNREVLRTVRTAIRSTGETVRLLSLLLSAAAVVVSVAILCVHQLVLVGHPTPGCGGSFAGGGFRGGMTSPGVVDATGGGVSSIDCC